MMIVLQGVQWVMISGIKMYVVRDGQEETETNTHILRPGVLMLLDTENERIQNRHDVTEKHGKAI